MGPPPRPAAPTRARTFDWFFLGLGAAIFLAWIYPHGGASGGWMIPEVTGKVGVALVFFVQGAGLSFAALRAGSLRWTLHLLVLGTTYGLFPLLGLGLFAIGTGRWPSELRLGFFFLCAVPSTISSSVIFTAIARGNVAAALWSATASNLLGVVLTPLWLGIVLQTSGRALPLGQVILGLAGGLVLPLFLGQLARRWIAGWMARRGALASGINRGIILFLVHFSFCDAFARNVWGSLGLGSLAIIAAVSTALLALSIGWLLLGSRALHLSPEERITAVFCGSQKTLAAGIPMAQLIFQGHPALGIILLPLLAYHPIELVASGYLANRWARRKG